MSEQRLAEPMFRFGCGHVTYDEAIHEARWGARLIYSEVVEGSSGVVWDRQTPDGDPDLVQSLFPVVEKATDEFRKVKYELSSDSRGRLAWRDGRVLVVMSPQGSYGYLYVTAVLERDGHVGETSLAAFETDPVPQFGNWPPAVLEARRLAELKDLRNQLEWREKELRWAEQDVLYGRTDRAKKMRQKKADAIALEVEALRKRVEESE